MKPRWVLCGLTVRKHDVIPRRIFGVKSAADVQGIHAKAVEDEVLRLSELLHHIIDPDATLHLTEMSLEFSVGNGGNAGTGRGSKVHWDPVRLAVFDGSEDAFPRAHAMLWRLGRQIHMKHSLRLEPPFTQYALVEEKPRPRQFISWSGAWL